MTFDSRHPSGFLSSLVGLTLGPGPCALSLAPAEAVVKSPGSAGGWRGPFSERILQRTAKFECFSVVTV